MINNYKIRTLDKLYKSNANKYYNSRISPFQEAANYVPLKNKDLKLAGRTDSKN